MVINRERLAFKRAAPVSGGKWPAFQDGDWDDCDGVLEGSGMEIGKCALDRTCLSGPVCSWWCLGQVHLLHLNIRSQGGGAPPASKWRQREGTKVRRRGGSVPEYQAGRKQAGGTGGVSVEAAKAEGWVGSFAKKFGEKEIKLQ